MPSAVQSGAPAATEESVVDEECERRSSAAVDAEAASAGSSAAGTAAAGMSDEVAAKRQRSRDSAAAMQPLPLPEVHTYYSMFSATVTAHVLVVYGVEALGYN